MKTLFLTLVGVLAMLSANATPDLENKRVQELIADWERAKAYTKEYLDAMPEEGILFKPTVEMRSFAEQMLHLAMGNANITATSTGAERLFKENIEKSGQYKTKEALTQVVMESYDFVITTLKGLTDTQLNLWRRSNSLTVRNTHAKRGYPKHLNIKLTIAVRLRFTCD